jgi:hypothetical protein
VRIVKVNWDNFPLSVIFKLTGSKVHLAPLPIKTVNIFIMARSRCVYCVFKHFRVDYVTVDFCFERPDGARDVLFNVLWVVLAY